MKRITLLLYISLALLAVIPTYATGIAFSAGDIAFPESGYLHAYAAGQSNEPFHASATVANGPAGGSLSLFSRYASKNITLAAGVGYRSDYALLHEVGVLANATISFNDTTGIFLSSRFERKMLSYDAYYETVALAQNVFDARLALLKRVHNVTIAAGVYDVGDAIVSSRLPSFFGTTLIEIENIYAGVGIRTKTSYAGDHNLAINASCHFRVNAFDIGFEVEEVASFSVITVGTSIAYTFLEKYYAEIAVTANSGLGINGVDIALSFGF